MIPTTRPRLPLPWDSVLGITKGCVSQYGKDHRAPERRYSSHTHSAKWGKGSIELASKPTSSPLLLHTLYCLHGILVQRILVQNTAGTTDISWLSFPFFIFDLLILQAIEGDTNPTIPFTFSFSVI